MSVPLVDLPVLFLQSHVQKGTFYTLGSEHELDKRGKVHVFMAEGGRNRT